MKIDLILHLKRYTLACVQVSSSSSVCTCPSMLWNVPALTWVAEALDAHPLREVGHLLLAEENYRILRTEILGLRSLGQIGGGKCRLAECLLCRECGSIRAWGAGDCLCLWIHYRVSCCPHWAGLILPPFI